MALYNDIERIHHNYPEMLRILKINNNLETEERSILMNLMYKNKVIIEVKLGINLDKPGLINCSNIFKKMIFDLQKSFSGPLTTLCNMWMSSDPRSDFYQKKEKELQEKPLEK